MSSDLGGGLLGGGGRGGDDGAEALPRVVHLARAEDLLREPTGRRVVHALRVAKRESNKPEVVGLKPEKMLDNHRDVVVVDPLDEPLDGPRLLHVHGLDLAVADCKE